MCFSATASFAASAVLAPSGLYGLRQALKYNQRYIPITLFVLVFAFHQAVEGFIWLALVDGNSERAALLAKVFLFISHFFLPLTVPLASYAMELDEARRRLFLLAGLIGAVFATLLYFPLLAGGGRVSVEIVHHSISYITDLFYDAFIPRDVTGAVYVTIVASPLILSSDNNISRIGWIIIISVIPAYFIYYHAFTSVWCFFAAIISIYIVYIVVKVARIRRDQVL